MSLQTKAIPIVIDANVLLAFYLPAEPYKIEALTLLGEVTKGQVRLVVPTLTRYEVLNVLSRITRKLKKGQELSMPDAQEILTAIEALKLEEHEVQGLGERILEIAHKHQCSVYDAAYLALAEQIKADFLTGDERFYKALKGQFKQVKFIDDYEAREDEVKLDKRKNKV